MQENQIIDLLKKTLSEMLLSAKIERERKVLAEIKPEGIRDAASALVRNDVRFIIIAALDSGLDIELLYHVDLAGRLLVLKTKLPKEAPEIDSIADIIPGTEWAEREAAELVGARFRNSPNQTHLVLKKDWEEGKFPLAKPFKRLPDVVAPVAESIATVGATAPLTPLMQRKREEAGLASQPPLSYSIESQMKEVHQLIEQSGFVQRGGYDPERRKLRGVRK